jgi:CRP-like cAMP-binding protein
MQPMRFELLASLDEADARSVLASARRRRFGHNEVVFHEGDPGDAVHLIDRGRVAIRVTTPLGDTAVLRILGPGDAFGELAILEAAPRSATAVALEPTETLSLHRDRVEELRLAHPGVERVVTAVLTQQLRSLTQQLSEALYLPVPKRVCRRLSELAELYRGEGGRPVVVPLTQDDIAGLSGATRPTVNKVLGELRDAGAVQVARGRITIIDETALARAGR